MNASGVINPTGLMLLLGFAVPVLAQDQYSANVLSYVDRHLVAGSNFVSSPLSGGDNSVSNVFRDLPAGSYVALWDPALGDFGAVNARVEGAGWTDDQAVMGPRQGAVAWVEEAQRISWVGNLQPGLCVGLPLGPTVTSVLPVQFCGFWNVTEDPGNWCFYPFTNPGNGVDGAGIRFWDPGLQAYGAFYLFIGGLGWLDTDTGVPWSQPELAPGHSVLVELPSAHDFCPMFQLGRAGSPSSVPLMNPARNGNQFSVQLYTQGYVQYCLRRAPQLAPAQWETVSRAMGPSAGGLLTLFDHDAPVSMAFYRVDCLWLFNPERSGGTFSLQFDSEEGFAYDLERKVNLGQSSWSVVQTQAAPAGGGRLTMTDESAIGTVGHYRVRQRLP